MIINTDKCFIFYHIPKCAGTTTRDRIMSYDSYNRYFYGYEYNEVLGREVDKSHITHSELRTYPNYISDMEKYYKFCFVRNPYSRLYSSWIQYKKHFMNGLSSDERKTTEDFNQFVSSILTKENIETNHKFTHFKPVYMYVNDENDLNIMDYIRQIENYEHDFYQIINQLKLTRFNKQTSNLSNKNTLSNDTNIMSKYSKESLLKINDLYNLDFEIGNYKKNAFHLIFHLFKIIIFSRYHIFDFPRLNYSS